ncbi:MAG: hypothetical protein IK130_12525 [Oscillospiraceae bacterium]|nr:hypothetical protein [Oscillospiraceae bacterium]
MKKCKSLIAVLLAACMLVSCGAKATITIPADIAKNMSTMDVGTKNMKYESRTNNSDGSITYEITVDEQQDILEKIRDTFDKAVPEMQHDPIKSIYYDKDFTSFKISTSSTSLTIAESVLLIVFYIYGAVYQIYEGKTDPQIVVEYVNVDSGNVIKRIDSEEIRKQFTDKF